MDVFVCGPRGGVIKDAETVKTIENATTFFAKLLRLHTKRVRIEIRLCNKKQLSGAYGDCEYIHNTDINTVLIRIAKHSDPKNPLGPKHNGIGILAHELCHAIQYVNKRLVEEENGTYWSYSYTKGANRYLYDYAKHASSDTEHSLEVARIYEAPWEVEAYAQGAVLFRAWKLYGKNT